MKKIGFVLIGVMIVFVLGSNAHDEYEIDENIKFFLINDDENPNIKFNKIAEKKDFSITYKKLKYKITPLIKNKKVNLDSWPDDNGEVTELSRFLQNKKINLSRRYQNYEEIERYIPEDCDKGYWNDHHIRHYCDWFKVGGKPWKDQETFQRYYLYWENQYNHQTSD
ncbi:hypothetical protein HQ529_06355 [Candidatus Woesearchaeota archaeon]|nr:hypothetical protein [Candidatus Woesearchaeota archaeon]